MKNIENAKSLLEDLLVEAKLTISFHECEHEGDASRYELDIAKAGGKVVNRIMGDNECSITVNVSNQRSFLKKLQATKSWGFADEATKALASPLPSSFKAISKEEKFEVTFWFDEGDGEKEFRKFKDVVKKAGGKVVKGEIIRPASSSDFGEYRIIGTVPPDKRAPLELPPPGIGRARAMLKHDKESPLAKFYAKVRAWSEGPKGDVTRMSRPGA